MRINASYRDRCAPLLFLDLCCCPLNCVASHIHFNAGCPFSVTLGGRLWERTAPEGRHVYKAETLKTSSSSMPHMKPLCVGHPGTEWKRQLNLFHLNNRVCNPSSWSGRSHKEDWALGLSWSCSSKHPHGDRMKMFSHRLANKMEKLL